MTFSISKTRELCDAATDQKGVGLNDPLAAFLSRHKEG